MEHKLIFHVFHSFLTIYESWTTPIACINVLCTLGKFYIEAFTFFSVVFIHPLFLFAYFCLLHRFKFSALI